MKECIKKTTFKWLLNQDYVRYYRDHLIKGNTMFEETADIQCACLALFAISYSTLKQVGMGLV